MSNDPVSGAAPSQAPFSENLNRTLRRALSIAEEHHHGVSTPEHLVLALTDDPDAAPVMQACDVDLDKLRLALSSSLSSQGSAADGTARGPDAGFGAILQRAVARMQSTGKNQEITGAHVLVAMLMSTVPEPLAELLRHYGITPFDALRYISHGLRKGEAMTVPDEDGPATGAAMLELKLLNDDYTPMEFVVEVLQRVFNQDSATATRTMLWAHKHGVATCGSYPADIARAKAAQVIEFARAREHPLRCVAAAVRGEALRENASPPLPTSEWAPTRITAAGDPAPFSRELVLTLHRAVSDAAQREHEYVTMEHLLLALIDDADAAAAMKACEVDLGALKENLAGYIDNDLKTLMTDNDRDPTPTPAVQRVVESAALHARALGRDTTGADLLVAMFGETESAMWLSASSMTQQEAASVVDHGNWVASSKGRIRPVVVRRSRKRGKTAGN